VNNRLFLFGILTLILIVPGVLASFKTYVLPGNAIVEDLKNPLPYKVYEIEPEPVYEYGPSGKISLKSIKADPGKTIGYVESTQRQASELNEDDPKTSYLKEEFPYKPLKKEETDLNSGSASGPISALGYSAQSTPDPIKTHITNDVLDLYFYEKESGSLVSSPWKYLYDGTNWGDSSYYEHFGVYTSQGGLIESENLDLVTAFSNSESNSDEAVLSYNSGGASISIKREVVVPKGSATYFTLRYTLTANSDIDDLRFYQITDFDVPDTGASHQCDDDASYDSLNDHVIVEDSNYFKNGFSANLHSSRHGIGYYSDELHDDWDNCNLNNNDDCSGGACMQESCTDPAVGLQYDLGDIDSGRQKIITFTYWFGQPLGFLTNEITIYPAASFNQNTKQLVLRAYAYDNVNGEKIMSGTGSYKVYDAAGSEKKNGSMSYSGIWSGSADLAGLNNGNYYAVVDINGYEAKAYFAIVSGTSDIGGFVFDDGNPVNNASVYLYRTGNYFQGRGYDNITYTNSSGYFSLNNIKTGSFIIEAKKGLKTGKTLSFVSDGKDSIYSKNISITSADTSAKLNFYMIDLKDALINHMENETKLIADISQSVGSDLGQSSDGAEINEAITNVLNGGSALSAIENVVVDSLEKSKFAAALEKSVENLVKFNPNDLATENEKEATLLWITEGFPNRTLSEFKVKAPYPAAFSSIMTQNDEFMSNPVMLDSNFDVDLARQIIAGQKEQLNIKDKEVFVLADSDVIGLALKKLHEKYKKDVWAISILGDVLTTESVFDSSHYLAIGDFKRGIVSAIGTGVMAVAKIAGILPQFKVALTIVKIGLSGQAAIDFAFAAGAWINDIQSLPNVYEETSELLQAEADFAHYLNKNNKFNSSVSVDLNEDYTVQNGMPVVRVENTGLQETKTATITIRNEGQDSSIRAVIKNNLIWHMQNVKETENVFNKNFDNLFLKAYYFNESLAQDEELVKEVEYTAYLNNQMLNPHILDIKIYNGPFMTSSEQVFYYSTPTTLQFAPVNALGVSDNGAEIQPTIDNFDKVIVKSEKIMGGTINAD